MRHCLSVSLATLCFCTALFAGDKPTSGDAAVQLKRSGNDFALRMYRELAKDGENVLVSPYGLFTVMAVVNAGAKGNTKAQIDKAMGLPSSGAHSAFQLLNRSVMANASTKPRLLTANALWLQKGLQLDARFAANVKTYYGALISEAPKMTRDMIPRIVTANDIGPDSTLMITNAIYFKDYWRSRFSKSATRTQDFWTLEGKVAKTPMMNQVHDFTYTKKDSIEFIRLPYAGGTMSMLVLLPEKAEDFPALEATITRDWLTKTARAGISQEVQVSLPRFKFDTVYNLIPPMQKLGVTDVFTAAKSDLSATVAGKPTLYVSLLRQKAIIEVDEAGTRAAAVTTADLAFGGAPAEPVHFNANRPFMFLLVNNRTSAIIFIGRVVKPTE
jgi:serpin B